MGTTLKQKMDALSAERREKIEARAAELVAEELSLRDLRHAHRLTQERVGEFLGIGQEGVSRLEKRSDLLISTLRSYVEAMGGHLRLVAEFPDRPAVVLSGLAAVGEGGLSPRPSRGHRRSPRSPRSGQRSRDRR
jgi:Helix-turn-helix domain